MDPASWRLEFHSGIPVYKQIMHHVQAAIASGAWKEGDQLPTIRALHEQLGINPNTVARAYRDLEALGLIEGHRGSGSFIAPAAKPASPLSPQARQAKAGELVDRLVAEARSHQIPLQAIIDRLRHEPHSS